MGVRSLNLAFCGGRILERERVITLSTKAAETFFRIGGHSPIASPLFPRFSKSGVCWMVIKECFGKEAKFVLDEYMSIKVNIFKLPLDSSLNIYIYDDHGYSK
jgi:hypothetical protein